MVSSTEPNSNAVLFLSINTHKHRANHSSAILLWGMSKTADPPNSVKAIVDTSYTTSAAANILLKLFRAKGTV
jgi:hypothetical protein